MKPYIVLLVSATALTMTTQAMAWSLEDVKEKISDVQKKIDSTGESLRSSLLGRGSGSVTNKTHSMDGNYQADAYGLGTNADQFGRSFNWQYRDGSTISPIFNNDVKPDAYGLGVGMDRFGRPVRRKY